MSKNPFNIKDVRNHVSHNGFDLSEKKLFTAKCGELLPIMHRTVMPGDKFRITKQHLTRTIPVDTAAYTRLREHFEFFFVPYDQLYRPANQVLENLSGLSSTRATSLVEYTQVNEYLPNIVYSAPQSQETSYLALFPSGTQSFDNTTPKPEFRNDLITSLASMLNNVDVSSRYNEVGRNPIYATIKLLNYLGYGYHADSFLNEIQPYISKDGERILGKSFDFGVAKTQTRLSLLPLAAYQKIYFDYYRNEQWEKDNPSCYNFDYMMPHINVDSSLNNVMQTTTTQCTLLKTHASFGSSPSVSFIDFAFNNFATLRYRNFKKDLFFGCLPRPQAGNTTFVPTSPIFKATDTEFPENGYNRDVNTTYFRNANALFQSFPRLQNLTPEQQNIEGYLYDGSNYVTPATGGFAIQDFRIGMALQRYREVVGSARHDFVNETERQFGVKVPQYLSHKVQFLGEFSNWIGISAIVNNNLDTADSTTDIKGIGVGSSSDNDAINFKAMEFGIIMCIYSVEPQVDYEFDGFAPDLLKCHASSFANPAFDNIGYEPIPKALISDEQYGSDIDMPNQYHSQNHLGFNVRYWDYKTGFDNVLGAFRETLVTWVAPLNFNTLLSQLVPNFGDASDANTARVNSHISANGNMKYHNNPNYGYSQFPGYGYPIINYAVFKINPSLLDTIFFAQVNDLTETDQFLVNCNLSIKALRPLSWSGLPY
ncbi:major capsid protein [Capybara microvirus Cap1_SP_52]|nr:major capsid protein [Capybara microvirus Cap1_SP_52]